MFAFRVLKPSPVVLTRCAVVTNVSWFISMTLLELKAALAGKCWLAGHWSVREFGDREQCGVYVMLEVREAPECAERENSERPEK